VIPPALLFAAAALIPAMTGTPGDAGAEQVRMFTLALCAGGSMMLPLGNQQPAPATAPCCAKGCHAGGRRRRGERTR
jgi:hypothetical protein